VNTNTTKAEFDLVQALITDMAIIIHYTSPFTNVSYSINGVLFEHGPDGNEMKQAIDRAIAFLEDLEQSLVLWRVPGASGNLLADDYITDKATAIEMLREDKASL
jgi:hypothetical protein